MVKVNYDSTGKYRKTEHSKSKHSYIFHVKQKSIQFLKHGKSEFPLYGKSMGKHIHSKIMMGFLIFLRETEIHIISKTCEKWIPQYGKIMGKHKYSKGIGFLQISHETEIHATPKTWKKWILILRETYGKRQIFQSYWFLT